MTLPVNAHLHPIVHFLQSEGFPAEIDADGDISFKREGLRFYLRLSAEAPWFGKLFVPFRYRVDSPDEHLRTLVALNTINSQYRLVKAHRQEDTLWLSITLLHPDDPSPWLQALPLCMEALVQARRDFSDALAQPAPSALALEGALDAAPDEPASMAPGSAGQDLTPVH